MKKRSDFNYLIRLVKAPERKRELIPGLMRVNQGFTLIELLIVIIVITILASFAFVALNPLARFQDARNTKRWSDVNSMISAVKLYQVDNKGLWPGDVDGMTEDLYYQIGAGSSCNDTCSNPTVVLQTSCVDLSDLVDAGYLAAVPIDPNDPNANEDETRYYIARLSNGSIIVGACSEEQGSNSTVPDISVTR